MASAGAVLGTLLVGAAVVGGVWYFTQPPPTLPPLPPERWQSLPAAPSSRKKDRTLPGYPNVILVPRLRKAKGVEARKWLAVHWREFAVNAFATGAEAFVQRLYDLGATKVLVTEIEDFGRGPSSDTLYVTLPPKGARRERLLNFIQNDGQPDELHLAGNTLRVWWD
jgi:hypothetical protein